MQAVLTDETIQTALNDLTGWRFEENAIHREYTFATFTQAIYNVYNKVHLHLTTHDAGNKVTQKDLDLAKAIETIAQTRF